jgi:hypothetical protein
VEGHEIIEGEKGKQHYRDIKARKIKAKALKLLPDKPIDELLAQVQARTAYPNH